MLAEDTGFSESLPTGKGLLTFRDLEEAVERVAEIESDYEQHRRAARSLAEEFMESGKCLQAMLSACGQ